VFLYTFIHDTYIKSRVTVNILVEPAIKHFVVFSEIRSCRAVIFATPRHTDKQHTYACVDAEEVI